MKTTKKKSNFRGRVATNSKKKPRGSAGGSSHLTLPKGVSLLTFEDNVKKIRMDFMPYEVTDAKHPDKEDAPVGSLWYRRPYLLHRNIGADNKSYVCRQSVSGKCPICEYQKELFDTDKDAAVKLYPKPRNLYAPIPLDSKKHDAVPHVWDMAESLFQETLNEELDIDDSNEVFPDIEEGLTLEITIKWKSIGDSKPFPETRSIKFEERDEQYDESILESVPNLDECLNVLSYEDLKNAFFELNDETDEDEDEEEDEKPRAKKTVTSKKPVKKSRDEEEDDDDEEEEEEDEKPKKNLASTKRGSVSKRKPVEEEDAEEEDEEEDEKPAKKTTKRTVKLTVEAKHALAEDRCIACEGSGEDTRGNECPICGGTGLKPKKKATSKKAKDDDEEEDEDEPETTKKSTMSRTTNKTSKSTGKNKCPYGFKFGIDTDKKKECDACNIWNDCIDEKEK